MVGTVKPDTLANHKRSDTHAMKYKVQLAQHDIYAITCIQTDEVVTYQGTMLDAVNFCRRMNNL